MPHWQFGFVSIMGWIFICWFLPFWPLPGTFSNFGPLFVGYYQILNLWLYRPLFQRRMTCSQEFNASLTFWFCKYNRVNYFLKEQGQSFLVFEIKTLIYSLNDLFPGIQCLIDNLVLLAHNRMNYFFERANSKSIHHFIYSEGKGHKNLTKVSSFFEVYVISKKTLTKSSLTQ